MKKTEVYSMYHEESLGSLHAKTYNFYSTRQPADDCKSKHVNSKRIVTLGPIYQDSSHGIA